MTVGPLIRQEVLDALRRLDTCTVSDAIETFDTRLRNVGFADDRVRCMFEDLPPLIGYAATARLQTGDPPMTGGHFHDHTEWWNSILQIPPPRIVVLEDMDRPPGLGAFVGNMHAAILRALGCVGYVTNGAVRQLPTVRELGLHLFAGEVSVSHAYAHLFDFGCAVKIGNLEVQPGALLHGDRHGLLSVPKSIASRIPAVAAKLRQTEQRVIDFCGSKQFSVDKLRQVMKELV
jgi:4-hydroxy-4-methyl-2-oxoglutarate aldolase